MDDETRAADALAALQTIDADRIEYKADITPAVLDIENRDVTTLFSVDSLDRVGDITEVSAFRKSTSERIDRIPHLYMHDLNQPAIARILSFQPLKRIELPTDVQNEYPDATGGMACVSRYLKSGRGAEVFEGIKDGIGYQASFGYRATKAVPRTLPDGTRARVIKELQLFEVSTVAPGHAAHAGTRAYRLSKALEALNEIKAGWRHGKHDDLARLHEILDLVNGLLGIEPEPSEAEPQFIALTSEVDDVLARIDAMTEVSP